MASSTSRGISIGDTKPSTAPSSNSQGNTPAASASELRPASAALTRRGLGPATITPDARRSPAAPATLIT